MVNQRAIVGIVITALFHEHRIMMYPEARAKLSLLNEDADFIKNLHTIQIQLQLSRETQKIDRKMRGRNHSRNDEKSAHWERQQNRVR